MDGNHNSNDMEYSRDWITEYPEVDREYMETYPVTFGAVDPEAALRKKDLHVYVHVPFCATSCSFCTFLHFDRSSERVNNYVPVLLKEIDLWFRRDLFRNYTVRSIFFGGGTATSMTAQQIGEVLAKIRGSVDVAPDAEITVESHPNTVSEKYLAYLREQGVNRITYGIQSFHDENLRNLEILQTRERNLRILETTRRVGFDSLVMDLMFNLPGQRLPDLGRDLETFLELDLDGISCYRYVLDPENPMAEQKKARLLSITPSEEEGNEMYFYLVERLAAEGYVQYTQPDFAKPDKICRYTTAVWKAPQAEHVGFGCGALSYNVNNYSFVNFHDLAEYERYVAEDRLPVLLGTQITPDELMRKYFVLGIKCIEVDTRKFEELYGLPYQALFYEPVRKLQRLGMVEEGDGVLRLTSKGKLYVDYVCKQFYSHRNQGRFQPDGLVFADFDSCSQHPQADVVQLGSVPAAVAARR